MSEYKNEQYFETIKCFDNEVFNLEYHEKRMANTIGLNINLQDYIYPTCDELLKCKVVYDKNGIVNVEYSDYKEREIKKFKLVYDDNIKYKYKNVNRDKINEHFKKKGNADEIIFVKNGLITDTSIANIAIYDGNKWITPKNPLLEGTTKNRYLESAKIFEANINVDEFLKCKKIALMNAMIDFKIILL